MNEDRGIWTVKVRGVIKASSEELFNGTRCLKECEREVTVSSKSNGKACSAALWAILAKQIYFGGMKR